MGVIKEEKKAAVSEPSPTKQKKVRSIALWKIAIITMMIAYASLGVLPLFVHNSGSVTPIGNTTTYNAQSTTTIYQVTGTQTYTVVQVNYEVTTTNGQAQTTTITLSCQATTTDNLGNPAC